MLCSQRLLLRLVEEGDLEELRSLHNEESTLNKLTDPFHVSEEEQRLWFHNLLKSRSSRRYSIILKESSELIGVIRVDRIDLSNRNAEVGADIKVDYRRRGYAKEAYYLLLDYLFFTLGMHRLQLQTLDTNSPAISLYKSLGFKEEAVLRESIFRDGTFQNLVLMSILRREWSELDRFKS